jgi:dephospho-CoA kinase
MSTNKQEPILALQKKYIVGVTGGIGSGKSTVTRLFEDKGIQAVDADIVAREVVALNSAGLAKITARFGEQILSKSGNLNRSQLRELVFNDPQAKTDLNNILHPLIREEMLKQLAKTTSEYCLLVAPLLFENNLQTLCDCSLAVDISQDAQLARTLSRDGGNADTIKGIMSAQISRQERIDKADDIIDNSQDQAWLVDQVNDLHKKYLKNARLKLKQ